MPKSIRPWATAAIAVVGVGVIAVAPFEPLPPGDTVRITNSALELDPSPRPTDYYPQVVMRSVENASDRLNEYLAAPLPILTAVAGNQYTSLTDIVDAIEDGDVVEIVDAVIRAIAMPVTNLVKVVGSGQPFEMTASLIVRLALPIVSGVMAAGSTVSDVVDSLLDLDVVGAASAATNLPARIVDGLLNGRVDGVSDDYFGLLAPVAEEPVSDQLTGPVSFLIESLQEIGDTIAAPASPGEDSAPLNLGAAAPPQVEDDVDPPSASTIPENSDDPPTERERAESSSDADAPPEEDAPESDQSESSQPAPASGESSTGDAGSDGSAAGAGPESDSAAADE
ncbi:hypothetical protein PDG61_23970 [Mycolicibacterium sp. BiH015]|uniref:hypothetical protein n=1 Tax=Mycolicibacterium sp. BiH015 TaxID=3018808 RepID=UPI0022E48FD4|nr:hypothetical protein [Mycolicibacterium sp. BiH015]MDA2893987.1 hypothetical protein [Mycolicibacterium sp. BiH015]